MGKVRDYIRSEPNREAALWPDDTSMFTQINRYRQLSDDAGIHFALPKNEEPIARSPEHTHSLRAGLDSEEHIKERRKILSEVAGPNVLELGSGTGSLLRLIGAELNGLDSLVGVEFSPHFFGHAADHLADIPEGVAAPKTVFLVRADITQMDISPRRFNTVILASILHEIKSYYSTKEVRKLLDNIYRGLKNGGKTIIYDGFRRPAGMAKMYLETPGAQKIFTAYITANKRAFDFTRDGNAIILPTTDAIEFATKANFVGWEGELEEEYYPFSLAEYETMLRETGFKIEKTQTFPEEGRYLPGVRIENVETGEDEAPSHNNVMVIATK
ncbi:MAG: class I SAM-dependent methyltransferase [Candidatus Magasanikbacteria bacterium]|nr:class I SAM-dependent methyltransferase [Candidatus Magasanikbacteria bacterium]